jgi:hypothetical protein
MTDNLRIWKSVEKTNPAHTKQVNQRGGFTAISANYQVMRATETFGPVGIGWGYIAGDPIFHDTLLFVPVTLWHGDRANTFGPMLGCEEWKDKNGRVDSDASKKATTDALTKLLSHLGFNADVFLGRFDDSKYVEQMKREFADADKPAPDAPLNDDQRDFVAGKIDSYGVPVGDVCKQFNVQSLKELTFARAQEAIKWAREQSENRKAA